MSVIDRFGRKKLLLIGAAGMSFCLAITAFAFYRKSGGGLVLLSLMGYIGFFAFSQGSVIWVFLSEIFPNRVRARGQALGSFVHWIWCAVVSNRLGRSASTRRASGGGDEVSSVLICPPRERPSP